jgi:hypothetical protein
MEGQDKEPQEPIPFWQTILDDISLLLVIGLVVPTIFYTIWGIMELANLPIFTR